jgi:hypothetical protein
MRRIDSDLDLGQRSIANLRVETIVISRSSVKERKEVTLPSWLSRNGDQLRPLYLHHRARKESAYSGLYSDTLFNSYSKLALNAHRNPTIIV